MHAVKSINFELESWLGIWNFGLESEIFRGIPNLTHDFSLVSGPSRGQ